MKSRKSHLMTLKELKALLPRELAEQELLQTTRDYSRLITTYKAPGKTVKELHAMLKLHEQTLTLPKNNAPLRNVNAEHTLLYIHSRCPRFPTPSTQEGSPQGLKSVMSVVRQGHWRGNCPQVLSQLQKKKKNVASGAVVAKLDLDSALLWHCRLGHISKKRIEKLQHDGLINSTDLRAFEKCVPCMSGKMARKPYTHQVERAKDLLGLIHTDGIGPIFKITSRQEQATSSRSTDDFSPV
ncbi:retrotransposon protein, putative, ty1-copia subclass [Tanacetum coccineum]